jgi:hypothetical protein
LRRCVWTRSRMACFLNGLNYAASILDARYYDSPARASAQLSTSIAPSDPFLTFRSGDGFAS